MPLRFFVVKLIDVPFHNEIGICEEDKGGFQERISRLTELKEPRQDIDCDHNALHDACAVLTGIDHTWVCGSIRTSFYCILGGFFEKEVDAEDSRGNTESKVDS